jgi:hypothetical protein
MKDLVNVRVNQMKTNYFAAPEVEVLVCKALIKLLGCSQTELTSTGNPVSEALRVEGSCGQSNRSKCVASLVATRKNVLFCFRQGLTLNLS